MRGERERAAVNAAAEAVERGNYGGAGWAAVSLSGQVGRGRGGKRTMEKQASFWHRLYLEGDITELGSPLCTLHTRV